MKSTIRVLGVLNIIFGVLSILGGIMSPNSQEAAMVFIGGGYVLANGILMTIYTQKQSS